MENQQAHELPRLQLMWRILFSSLGVAFVGLVLWAFSAADFSQSFTAITADPWGVVSLADLYLGFVLFAAIIFLVDGLRPASFAWTVALMLLGNAIAVAWLVLRWPLLTQRLSR